MSTSVFCIKQKFNNFENFHEELEKYEVFSGYRLTVTDSKKDKTTGEYMYKVVRCTKSGVLKSKGKGIRNKPSHKVDCPFLVRAKQSKDKSHVEISQLHLIHNHEPDLQGDDSQPTFQREDCFASTLLDTVLDTSTSLAIADNCIGRTENLSAKTDVRQSQNSGDVNYKIEKAATNKQAEKITNNCESAGEIEGCKTIDVEEISKEFKDEQSQRCISLKSGKEKAISNQRKEEIPNVEIASEEEVMEMDLCKAVTDVGEGSADQLKDEHSQRCVRVESKEKEIAPKQQKEKISHNFESTYTETEDLSKGTDIGQSADQLQDQHSQTSVVVNVDEKGKATSNESKEEILNNYQNISGTEKNDTEDLHDSFSKFRLSDSEDENNINKDEMEVLEENVSEVKVTDQQKNEHKNDEVKMVDDEVSVVQKKDEPKKRRGRPKGAVKTAVGLPIKSGPTAYADLNLKLKLIRILEWLGFSAKEIKLVTAGECVIAMNMMKDRLINLSNSFLADELDMQIFTDYFEPDCFNIFMKKIEEKKEEDYMCSVCNCKTGDVKRIIGCDGCLKWYHAKCLNIKITKKLKKAKSWFCKFCLE